MSYRARIAVPTLLTFARVPLGLGVLGCSLSGASALALDLYLAGLITDVLDGMSARALGVTSEFGKRWDQRADMFFNSLSYIGAAAIIVGEGSGLQLGALALLLFGFAASLAWISARSPAAKYRSGVVRVVLVSLFLSMLAPDELALRGALAAALLVGGGLYELGVVRRAR